jgi:O-antigen/teichoic acid export membrane protein
MMESENTNSFALGDLGGKGRFSRNVAFAWGSYVAQAAAGFVMPRLISDSLGQATLGVWDLAWSLVAYLGFVELGLSGSVNRFVARYRAKGDVASLTRSVSTVGLFLMVAGAVAVPLTFILSVWVLPLFSPQLGPDLPTAQFVVIVLGLEVAVSLMFAVYLGVIVGSLRSDAHYAVSTVVNILTAFGMVGALLAGGSLPTIALVHFLITAGGGIARWRLARLVCPELVVEYSTASWRVWREQARFTVKSTLPTIADVLVNQSVGVLVAFYLGPATLAIFSRPRNLVRQVRTLTARFGYVLIPAASSLHALSEHEELAKNVREKSFHIALATMPVAITLAILGDDLIRLWMGEGYVYRRLVPILALGALPTWVQEPGWSILSGMNRHGGLAIAKVVGSICAATMLAIGLSLFEWGLLPVALGLVVPMAIVDGFIVPLFVCRAFGFRLGDYCQNTWLRPALCVAPYAVCLMLARQGLGREPLALLTVLAVSTPSLALTYWLAVLPLSVRNRILCRLSA